MAGSIKQALAILGGAAGMESRLVEVHVVPTLVHVNLAAIRPIRAEHPAIKRHTINTDATHQRRKVVEWNRALTMLAKCRIFLQAGE